MKIGTSAGTRRVHLATALAVLLAGVAVAVAAAPASASSIGPPVLYKVLDTHIAANCVGSHSTHVGTVSLRPYFNYGSTDFQTTSGNALVVETYEELGYSTAQKYVSCVHGDWDYVYYGAHAVKRKVTIVWDCYGASCFGPIKSYGPWTNGWG